MKTRVIAAFLAAFMALGSISDASAMPWRHRHHEREHYRHHHERERHEHMHRY